jgi:putative spermidine/putrescine transport system substrate-binding protein
MTLKQLPAAAAVGLPVLALVLGLVLDSAPSRAQDKLVISGWGGNFKDGIEQIIGVPFTKETGMAVQVITGGTLDRLTRAKLAKGNPESDITLTSSHVGALYVNEGLFEQLDMSKIPNAKDLYPVAVRSPYHLGLYTYVYTPVFRSDLMPPGYRVTSWRDLWGPEVKGKLGLPDYDPSHIIVVAALLAGGSAENWQVGEPLLEQLKPSIKAFFQTDAVSEEMMKTGETPIQVRLSISAFHEMAQKLPITIAIPKEGAVVNVDAIAINKGAKHLDAAYKFLNLALDPDIQKQLAQRYHGGPVNSKTKLDPEFANLPGVFTTAEQWRTQAITIDDATRARLLPAWNEWFGEHIIAR